MAVALEGVTSIAAISRAPSAGKPAFLGATTLGSVESSRVGQEQTEVTEKKFTKVLFPPPPVKFSAEENRESLNWPIDMSACIPSCQGYPLGVFR